LISHWRILTIYSA